MKIENAHGAENSPISIRPAFAGCTDAIVFCANDYYCPYLSVMLYSVIEQASPSRKYDIIVLHRDITPENQRILQEMGEGKDNIAIRFLNVSSLISAYSLYTGGKTEFTIDTYLRLLIPDVLDRTYHKALYLDSDMLALADVGELLDTDLDGYLLASSRDMCGLACYYDPRDERRRYRDGILHLSQPNDYFIAGMLVLNLDAFRKAYTFDELLRLAASRNWLQHDQDVLNLICDGGKAKILHASWDVMKPYRPDLLPEPYRVELEESLRNPKIIHFGGTEKPWKNLDSPWMDLFWDTAVKTPYYKEIIFRNLHHDDPDSKDCEMTIRINNGEIRLRHMVRFNIAWIIFKLRSKLHIQNKR